MRMVLYEGGMDGRGRACAWAKTERCSNSGWTAKSVHMVTCGSRLLLRHPLEPRVGFGEDIRAELRREETPQRARRELAWLIGKRPWLSGESPWLSGECPWLRGERSAAL